MKRSANFNPRAATTTWFFGHMAAGAAGAVQADAFQVWEKPKNASMVFLFCLGGGGGGGAGLTGASATARGGGGGGGSGAIATLLIPALVLPKLLYVKAGRGTVASTALSRAGQNGNSSIVLTTPDQLVNPPPGEIILVSENLIGTNQARGGAAGTAAGGDLGGVGGIAITGVEGAFEKMGVLSSIGGYKGGNAGPLGAAGVATTWGGAQGASSGPFAGGAGGGSASAANAAGAGGNVDAPGPNGVITGQLTFMPIILGGATGGGLGGSGTWTSDPFCATGGAGGGATGAAGVAGAGGDGGYGCGGGGGGGGVTLGVGGRGGPGVVMIAWW